MTAPAAGMIFGWGEGGLSRRATGECGVSIPCSYAGPIVKRKEINDIFFQLKYDSIHNINT